jgi:nucleoside-diphosphate-sugar epimerase
MIVGDGMIASALADIPGDLPGAIVFAAGVSDSTCADPAQFERERETLAAAIATGRRVIYVSTCSVQGVHRSPYIDHKRHMERLVSMTDHLIVRLPIVIGQARNRRQLIPFLFDRITAGEPIDVQSDTCRHVIDIQDVSSALSMLRAMRGTVNLAHSIAYTVEEIVAEIEVIVGRPARIRRVPAGHTYPVEPCIGPPAREHYLRDALRFHYANPRLPARSTGADLRTPDAAVGSPAHARDRMPAVDGRGHPAA